jgi:hypothetical protein
MVVEMCFGVGGLFGSGGMPGGRSGAGRVGPGGLTHLHTPEKSGLVCAAVDASVIATVSQQVIRIAFFMADSTDIGQPRGARGWLFARGLASCQPDPNCVGQLSVTYVTVGLRIENPCKTKQTYAAAT